MPGDFPASDYWIVPNDILCPCEFPRKAHDMPEALDHSDLTLMPPQNPDEGV